MNIDQGKLADLYSSLYKIRKAEEAIADIYPSDKIKSPVHLSIGQEAVASGVCEALMPDDVVFGTYRSHAMYIAKGGDLKKMFAELYGKDTGCARGKGGSMHLVDVATGVMGTSAVVGTTISNAVGYAYALKMRRESRVVVSFFGDGAIEEGTFHESLNFAVLKKLPILFVCENNLYAIHSHQKTRQAMSEIYEWVRSYGIRSCRIDSNDVRDIYAETSKVRTEITAGDGPYLLECMTYRWREHVGPGFDYSLGYRSEKEATFWLENDQLGILSNCLDAEERKNIEKMIDQEITEAVNFAEESPFPEVTELYTHVFK